MAYWATAALILLLPLFAMQVTGQVAWSPADFAFAGTLLVGVGVAYELAARRTGNTAYRAAVGVALAAAFILVWANGAVGIIGTEDNPANALYGGVLAVGLVGAIIARFQPDGMARALIATAIAQASVPMIALLAGPDSAGPIRLPDVLMATGFFAAMWLISAWLFRKAAQE